MLEPRTNDVKAYLWIAAALGLAIAFNLIGLRDARPSDRPWQCPHRYCGCALSLELFGRADPQLFPAINWLKFRRASPAPGMVAVRRHHVMLLRQHVRGREYVVYDPNSGGGLTRVHVRSISGFVIVDPRMPRMARI